MVRELFDEERGEALPLLFVSLLAENREGMMMIVGVVVVTSRVEKIPAEKSALL